MTFFNKKQDVLDIKMTQYGKHLLSKGKFKPHYYAFFDDDVLYDATYAGGMEEAQNSTEPRIQEDTPQLKPQYIYTGAETSVLKANEMIRTRKAKLGSPQTQPTPERESVLSRPLGTSKASSNKIPSWRIELLDAVNDKFTNVTDHLTGALQTLPIPQLDFEIKWVTSIRLDVEPPFEEKSSDELESEEGLELHALRPDSTYISVKENDFVIEVTEENCPFLKENFDVEVFIIEDEDVSGNINTPGINKSTKRQNLKPLSFIKKTSLIKPSQGDGILMDPSEVREGFDVPVCPGDGENLDGGPRSVAQQAEAAAERFGIDEEFVEYFMDISVDGEVSSFIGRGIFAGAGDDDSGRRRPAGKTFNLYDQDGVTGLDGDPEKC